MYSLIGTAKLNDLDPEAYLRYVIERIGDHLISSYSSASMLPSSLQSPLNR